MRVVRRHYFTACPRRTSSPILQNLVIGAHTPLTAASTLTRSETCADHPFVRSAAHTQRKTERRCYAPRVTQAAMIAAASFGLRRSGTFATATSGAAYWAASVRHGPPWPLPVNAPKSIFQKSNLYRAANSGFPSSLKGGAGGGGRELWFQTRPYSHGAKHLGLHDHLSLVPPLIQLEKSRVNFGAPSERL